jgi:ArsR family transcriptional regulator
MVKVFKALGEPTRLRLVKLMSVQELCVCEIEELTGMNQPRISQHLRVLKEAGIVSERREAQLSFVSLSPGFSDFLSQFQAFLKAPLHMVPDFEAEAAQFARMGASFRARNC